RSYGDWSSDVCSSDLVMLSIYFSHHQYQDGVRKRMAVMEKAHRQTIEALAVTINAKDEVTHEHVMRVQVYAAGVARLLGCSELEIGRASCRERGESSG